MKGRCQHNLRSRKAGLAAAVIVGLSLCLVLLPLPLRALDPLYPPAPRTAEVPQALLEPGWMRQLGLQQQQLVNQKVRVCFIGDSLTEFWTHTGAATWNREMAPLKAANLGIAGDRTENILYRIQRLDFSRSKPELAVLMMGTNNLGTPTPDPDGKVVEAIQKAVTLLKTKLPATSTILILGLPPNVMEPRGAFRQRVKTFNAQLAAAPWPAGVKYVPVYEAFVDAEDRWKPGLTVDGTHFSAAGYEELAKVLGPMLPRVKKEEAPLDPFGGKRKR